MNSCKKECPLLSASIIKLTQGKYAIIDADEYKKLSKYNWHALRMRRRYNAVRNSKTVNGKRGLIYLHREIMGLSRYDGKQIDHINHNALDNRRCNLRYCTGSQNGQNKIPNKKGTSKYKGVHWHKRHNKWMARITVNKVTIHLGYFNSEIDAAKAYDNAAIKYHKEFAYLNFKESA